MAKLEIIKYSDMPDGSDIITALGCYFKNYFYNNVGDSSHPKYKHYLTIEITDEPKKKEKSIP